LRIPIKAWGLMVEPAGKLDVPAWLMQRWEA
jgi:hypothetical protein